MEREEDGVESGTVRMVVGTLVAEILVGRIGIGVTVVRGGAVETVGSGLGGGRFIGLNVDG